MQIVTSKDLLRGALSKYRGSHQTVVFVPTMGALHEGHRTLMAKARQIAGEDGVVVASIFVNPIQFDNPSDLSSYPRTMEQDLAICANEGVNYVFTPSSQDMYADQRSIIIDETSLSGKLCGASRPGHFAGVCTVVAKLFNLVQPTDAVFGKKDYQQLAIIRRMVRDLDFPIRIHGAEIVRHEDGLAYSSRNVRLSEENRAAAPVLYQTLLEAKQQFAEGKSLDEIKQIAESKIMDSGATKIDYLEIVNRETMQEPQSKEEPLLMALAVFYGDVRLIDNIEL